MKLNSRLFYGYLLAVIVYAGFTLVPAPLPALLKQYHLSPTGLRAIDLTIIVLLAIIWFVGFYGYAKLRAYVNVIRGEKDGIQVNKLCEGIFLVVLWLPVSSVTSSILNYIVTKHLGLLPAVKIFENYLGLVLPFVGFLLISQSARGLSRLARQYPSYAMTDTLSILLIYIGLIYYRLVATTSHRSEVYHMSIWFILLTLVAPYIYMWYRGLVSAYQLFIYQQKVAGVVYRRGWSLLSLGVGWLIMTSIIFQYVTTLSARLNTLSIYWLLAIVYSLLFILSVGFIFIAVGTRKLQRIEEV